MLDDERLKNPKVGNDYFEELPRRAEYGKRILATVSQELTAEFGQAFSLRSLYRAIQFHQRFPDLVIVSTLSAQLKQGLGVI